MLTIYRLSWQTMCSTTFWKRPIFASSSIEFHAPISDVVLNKTTFAIGDLLLRH